MSAPDINALLGSRICHDLISPLGAISNGLELLAMAGVVDGPELNLINESVENANARVRFFRVAFGAVSAEQEIGRAEILSTLAHMTGGRLTIDWQIDGAVPRAECKLAFLLLQCLESALPWGGRITAWRNGGRWRIEGRADRIKPLPDLWRAATRQATEGGIDASQVHFPLADRAAGEIDSLVVLNEDDGLIALSF
ncbi:histidine phosphotransferase family protein [Oceaniglobus trochenteri]|uniref:histidine phosphotransferase family protein n=1 Tax=Oceaniglobus trochenteri TaxID=2763260 RepID=UPI001CFFDD7F|nr:histidine phosphotransferase family protein [Oceaniglobus trochenteri]